MKILLVPKPGVDLYRTLYDSETSRAILRFYRPGRHPWGVEITVSSLGSAVSLISELRWYLQRYIQEVLIDVGEGVIISRALAREVYQRDLTLSSSWPHRMRFRIERGRLRRSLIEKGGEPSTPAPVPEAPVPVPVPGTMAPEAITLEVWTTPDEPVEDVVAEEEPVGDSGTEPPEGPVESPGDPEAGAG
ncbi:MAG: DUF5804 family protein [Methanomicrobiales archaeon]|nr:DUF5804 family protein [Methanomicrobiales archaeon]